MHLRSSELMSDAFEENVDFPLEFHTGGKDWNLGEGPGCCNSMGCGIN